MCIFAFFYSFLLLRTRKFNIAKIKLFLRFLAKMEKNRRFLAIFMQERAKSRILFKNGSKKITKKIYTQNPTFFVSKTRKPCITWLFVIFHKAKSKPRKGVNRLCLILGFAFSYLFFVLFSILPSFFAFIPVFFRL